MKYNCVRFHMVGILIFVSIFTEYDFMLLCLCQNFLLVYKGCQFEVQGILFNATREWPCLCWYQKLLMRKMWNFLFYCYDCFTKTWKLWWGTHSRSSTMQSCINLCFSSWIMDPFSKLYIEMLYCKPAIWTVWSWVRYMRHNNYLWQ